MWTFNHPVRSAAAQGAYQRHGGRSRRYGASRCRSPAGARREVPRAIPKLLDRLAAPPVTISHGDYRLDNLFFATPEGGDPLAVVDWQVMSLGRGLFDLAYFMSGACRRRTAGPRRWICSACITASSSRGVKGYDFDQCVLDYRMAALFCWQYAVIILGSLDTANERGMALFTDVLQRFVASIVDLNAAELLPA